MVADRVASVRGFNRFYTNVIGALREGLLDTPYSLTEARVLFELGQRDATEAVELRRELDIDAAYLTRLVDRFEGDGLVTRERSAADGRRRVLRLTRKGRKAFQLLDRRAVERTEALLAPLDADDECRLVEAMSTIQELLGPAASPAVALRPARPEDHEWVVRRHGALYAEEYGWDERFEALVAEIVARFAEGHDPEREQAWIAEAGGEPVGCVFCTAKSPDVAQLRLLLVEPRARGRGVGSASSRNASRSPAGPGTAR